MPHAAGSTSQRRALVASTIAFVVLAGCTRMASGNGPSAQTSSVTATVAAVVSPAAAVATPTARPGFVASPGLPAAAPRVASPSVTHRGGEGATAPALAAAAEPSAAANGVAVAPPVPAVPASASPATAPSAGAPQILSVATSPTVVHAGQTVSWDVRTTKDVATVTARVAAYTIPIARTGPGHFALNFAIPSNVPAFFHGTYNLNVTAATSGGATASRMVSLVFQ